MSAPQPSGAVLAHPDVAARSRRSAAGLRAEHLVSVTEGLLDVFDVIDAACHEGNKALLRISLRQLLLSQEGWGVKRTDDALELLATFTKSHVRMTIGWLVDPRARGTRLAAFLDVMSPRRDTPPWPGFPFARKPQALESS